MTDGSGPTTGSKKHHCGRPSGQFNFHKKGIGLSFFRITVANGVGPRGSERMVFMKKVGVITMLANGLISITHGNMVVTMMVILWVSAIVSSFLDNIPFVATLIPMILTMQSEGMDVAPIWWALSLGACLGGNGTLIGASANVVLSGISKNNGHPITFGQYFKIGFPMMILSIIVCSVFLLIRFA